MAIVLVSPRIAVQKRDFLGSGIPYWPIEAAILTAFLNGRGEAAELIDLFGDAPECFEEYSDHYRQGRPLREYLDQTCFRQAQLFIVYAVSYMCHGEVCDITRSLRRARPDARIAVLENTQAVTGYSLTHVAPTLFESGADALICGEPYHNWTELEAGLLDSARGKGLPNLVLSGERKESVKRRVSKHASYPVPAWEQLNLTGYWRLPYAHGPKHGSYLPLLSSRGCPYPCDFCVVPQTNERRWRHRAVDEVVAEILSLKRRLGVRRFHVEDLNPTVDSKFWRRIAEQLIAREAGIEFFFVSGTKAETVGLSDVPLLARAGCRYLSISPESGSARLLRCMGKSFDHDHGLDLIKACRQYGIRTQACLLVGHPDERDSDHRLSCDYLRRMIRVGLDEVAVFVVAPFAGSRLFEAGAIGLPGQTGIVSFSPTARSDYDVVEKRRRQLIRIFFVGKLMRGGDLWLQGWRALMGRSETKMENLPRRMLFVWGQLARQRVRQWWARLAW